MTSSLRAPLVAVGVWRRSGAGALGLGVATLWLSVIVLIPLAALVARSTDGGLDTFWSAVSSRQALAALKLSLWTSLVVAAFNAVAGTATAWVLVRDEFRGKGVINALIDLPFALPTIVVGIILLALVGPTSPVGIHAVATTWAILMALAFVTLPFVVRSVQPVVLELDREMEEAAVSLGARPATVFRRVVLPNLVPAILSGAAHELRAGGRRVRLGRARRRQHPLPHPAGVGLHLRAGRERRRGRRGGGRGGAARALAAGPALDRRACALGVSP